jgi:hypothetical protein
MSQENMEVVRRNYEVINSIGQIGHQLPNCTGSRGR